MENLYQRGLANGLAAKKLSASEVNEIEPHVSCLAGIHVPSTGIVDFVGVCRKLAELIGAQGGDLRLGTKVQGFRANGSAGVLETSKDTLSARWVVNCAGLAQRSRGQTGWRRSRCAYRPVSR